MRDKATLEQAIRDGGSVLLNGKIITRLDDLPWRASGAKAARQDGAAAKGSAGGSGGSSGGSSGGTSGEGSGDGSGGTADGGQELSAAELIDAIEQIEDPDQLTSMREQEKTGKKRSTVLKAIDDRLAELNGDA